MCNLIGFQATGQAVISFADITIGYNDTTFPPWRSGFDYASWPVIFRTEDALQLHAMHWEFIPSWIMDQRQLEDARKQGIPWFNATQEKLLGSRMFRDAALHRRCIVPVSFFVEWMHFPEPGPKKKISIPHVIQPTQQSFFWLAGIWQNWTDKSTGELKQTFALVTTEANERMSRIHNSKKRMPLALTETLAKAWMDDQSEHQIRELLQYKTSDDAMRDYTIAKDFRSRSHPLEPTAYGVLDAGTQGSLF